MSTIDFKAFLEENKAYIEPQYKLWTGNGFSTVNIVGGSAVSSDGLDEYIAPMQSFIVTAKTSTVSFPLIFDVEKMSVAKPSTTNSKLKNLPVTQGINNTGRK